MKSPKSSPPAPKPKPDPPSLEDTASSESVDWRDPSQMEKLRNELSAYLSGCRREDRCVSHRPGPTTASQGKESKKGPRLPEKEAPTSLPEKVTPPSLPQKEVLPGLPQETPPGLPQKEAPPSLPQKEVPPSVPQESPCSLPEREAATGLSLPPVDYIPQDSPTPSVRQIRNKLEARFSLSAEKEAKPSTGLLPPKPRLEGVRIFENRAENGKFSKPVAKNPPAPSTTPLPTTPRQSKAMPGPATPPKATPEPVIPSLATTLPTTLSQLTAEKNQVPARQGEKPEGQGLAVPSKPETEGRSSEASKPPTQEALSSPALPTKISPSREEVTFLYKPHRSQNSPGREVAVVMPTLSRGEAAGSGEPVEVKEPQGLPAKPQASAQPADQLLRHPVTGEVVERGSPMALLLAARQRAQKGRPRRIALGRSSLPGSLRVHSQPEAGSDVIYSHSQPNSFTVVPKISKETEDPQLTSPGQPKVPSQWKPQPSRDPEGTEPSRGHSWTKAEPQAPAACERRALSNLPQGRQPPKSFSSPPSPSRKREEEEFNFEVIPPPPEFSNDPEPQALQYVGRRGSPPRNNFSDSGPPRDAGPPRGFSRFPAGADPGGGAGGLERFSHGGRSLIKKRLYVGEPHRSSGLPRGGTGSPNCFGPPPGGPEMRRVTSAGRTPLGGLHPRNMSLEGAVRGEAKFKAPGGDCGCAPATGRSPHGNAHYGSSINTFTVRPGTRHPISYAYSGAHRKAPS